MGSLHTHLRSSDSHRIRHDDGYKHHWCELTSARSEEIPLGDGRGGEVDPQAARRTRPRQAALLVALAALTLGCWFAWLGWDTAYNVDPSTGEASGPYEIWQILGCVVTLTVLTALAVRRLWPPAVITTIALVFTLGFSYSAAISPEDDGLWPIGAAMVFVGTLAGALLVAAAVGRGPRLPR